jgi:hypothetical protein
MARSSRASRRIKEKLLSAGTGAEGRTRRERAGTHAEARAERRRNVAEEVAAAGATAINTKRSGHIGTEPLTAGFAKRIDALHREAGHILHFLSLSAASSRVSEFPKRQNFFPRSQLQYDAGDSAPHGL